jgi:hypothetical protein
MSIFRLLSRIWRNLIHRSRVEADLDAELGAYVDLATGQKVKSGMSSAEARGAAFIETGGVEQVKGRPESATRKSTHRCSAPVCFFRSLRPDLRTRSSWRGAGAGIAAGLKEGTEGGPRGERLRKALIAAQIALAVVLGSAARGSRIPRAGCPDDASGNSRQPIPGARAGDSLHIGMDG